MATVKKMKKAQDGMAFKMKKDSREGREMVSKIKEANKKSDSTNRKTGMNFDKKGFDSLPKLPMKKAQGGAKATPDSTDFFEKRADRYDKAASRLIRAGGYESVLRMKKVADQAKDDAWRQGFKGKPGYDANGFPSKKKAASKLPMKKSKDGSSFGMLSVKAGVDKNPNATFADKIAGAKKKAMSGTKMMKMGGPMKKAGKAIVAKKIVKSIKKK
jgi:hypothetical protein